SSRSRSKGRPRTDKKHRKGVSKKKGPLSLTVRASQRKSSSDSGYDTVSDSGSEDLSTPYRRPKTMTFTSRNARFRYHRRAKLPPNFRVYEGNKDSKDQLSIFFAATEQEEWPMPQKRYDKDPTKIHDIKRKPNEGLQAFMDCFKIEEAVASGRLAHLVKDIRQGGQKSKGSAKGKEKVINMASGSEEYMSMVVAPHRLCMSIASKVLAIERVIMEFAVVKSPSPYNALLGRTRMRSLGAIASIIHSMTKFSTLNGIATISTTRETLKECRKIEKAQDLSRHAHAYKGYHQIQMTKKDEKRRLSLRKRESSVHEDAFWSQEYRATYQRLVDSTFKERIRVNLEAYVDDMVIKKERKFLGYIVTSEGIRAKPKKAKAIMDMPSPKTIKLMQSLSGKLAALNRFLSKSTKRSLPFLDTLKKCTNKKDFRWTEADKATVLEMKKLVSELPTLTTTKKGETLMMCLAAANEAVSAELLIEMDRRQMPIHYVITDNPIGQVLNNSGASGRLAKWAIKLGAYGITYVPRVAIKGQVLADFLANTPIEINATTGVPINPKVEDIPEPSNARGDLTPGLKAWRLYIDGASNNEGSRAGLILIAPDDVEYSYALSLNFSNSNNDAEYEALLDGLRIAKEMQVKDIHAFVVQQFDHLSKEVLVEVLNERSIKAQEFNMVVEEEAPTWMTPIRNYLEEGKLPEDPTNYFIREVHMGSCGMHDGPRQVVAKAMNLGYFWSSMHKDVIELIRACDDWQAHAAVPRLPKAHMISETSAWIFMKFGIPGTIITDNETQFGNGAVERANKSLLRGIKTRLKKGGSAWAKEVPNVLWAHRTIKKTKNGETPFSLTYGTEAVIPAEIGMPTHKTSSVNEKLMIQSFI
nr:hypothetical protein [Tanacetum cinerariifolium]